MAKKRYRRRVATLEAEQFWPEKKPWPEGVADLGANDAPAWAMRTLEGMATVEPGDWIITGIKGERYPCKPEVFKQLYEPDE